MCVLLSSLGGCKKSFSSRGRTAGLERGPIEIKVRAVGSLKAKKFTRIRSHVEMEAKIIFLAEEGSTVKAGDILVKFDPTDLDRQIKTMKRNLDEALASLDAAETELSIQEIDGKNQVAKADLALGQAEKAVERYEKGDAPIQKRKLQISLEEAKSDLDRKQEKFKQMPELLKEGFVTALQVEEERINLEKAKVGWESAKRELELFETYTYPMELDRKNANVETARIDLEAVKKRTASQLKQRTASKLSRENHVRELRQELQELQEKIGKMVLKAPTGGLVIFGESGERRRWRDDDEIRVGSRVWPRETIITLPDMSEMIVQFRVHEADINKIRPGIEGSVVVDSYGAKTFKGKIIKIADLANAGGWRSDPDVREFDVEILLDGRDLGLKPGVTARVEIVVDRKEDVLRVPITAVHGKPGEFHCFVQRGGGIVAQAVELGMTSETHSEVLSGLDAQDTVLLGAAPEEQPPEPQK
jgi:multidrug resistance efflux pump